MWNSIERIVIVSIVWNSIERIVIVSIENALISLQSVITQSVIMHSASWLSKLLMLYSKEKKGLDKKNVFKSDLVIDEEN